MYFVYLRPNEVAGNRPLQIIKKKIKSYNQYRWSFHIILYNKMSEIHAWWSASLSCDNSLAILWGTIKVQPASPSSASPYGQWTLADFLEVFTLEIMKVICSLCVIFLSIPCLEINSSQTCNKLSAKAIREPKHTHTHHIFLLCVPEGCNSSKDAGKRKFSDVILTSSHF